MRLYKIKVNGKAYEVEVESVTETEIKKPFKIETSSHDDKVQILAPIQGKVIKSNVQVGTQVKKGSVLIVLESMKLENDVLSPIDGYVSQVFIEVGQKVEFNQLMLVIG
ncbi:MAG: biotin/lipoyl-binding protein [Acholeplasmataceae bacterium]|nr:biotin/lipoyl-binding protein [Acholeplasmataceae bacterium]